MDIIIDLIKTGIDKNLPLRAALYCRISREDDTLHNVSVSIDTQKHKLTDFAQRSDIEVFKTYCDDGFSGTNYNRPAFGNMLSDIKAGSINCVIVKDLSRLGREYIQSGQLLENFFPKYDTRFIAIDDNIDLDPTDYTQTSNMIIPFFNLMNELYPADISKKTRSALQTKGSKGEYLSAYPPFGYKKSLSNKNKLVIDEPSAEWISYIFKKAAEGWSLSKIARELHFLKVPTATDLRKGTHAFDWGSSAIKIILDNETYLGKTIYGKTRRLSYKNKKIINVPKEKWHITENTHDALISETLFREVHLRMETRARENSCGTIQMFSGKVKCPDCNNSLNFCTEPRKENPNEGYFVCRSNKRFGNKECSRHYIRYSVLEKTVFEELKILLSIAAGNSFDLYKFILTEKELTEQKLRGTVLDNLLAIDIRLSEIERIFVKLYQDKALGEIAQQDYSMVYENINTERAVLKNQRMQNEELALSLSVKTQEIDIFIEELMKFNYAKKLTREMINQLIDYIDIENVSKEFGKKTQYINIYYKNLGFIKKTEVKIV